MNHVSSAYLKLNDHNCFEDKLATGQLAIRRHSPIPVDPLSGVYTGFSEEQKVSKDKLLKSDVKDVHRNEKVCLIHTGHKEDNSQRISIKSGRKEWF